LKKTIYGLVQSAREFYNKLLSTLKSIGFTENKSDPCFLSKWTNENVVLIGIYVDDCLVVGKDLGGAFFSFVWFLLFLPSWLSRSVLKIDDISIPGTALHVSMKNYLIYFST
jgi:Reverse transcriptase (RNA-dependent DNA polymerase)